VMLHIITSIDLGWSSDGVVCELVGVALAFGLILRPRDGQIAEVFIGAVRIDVRIGGGLLVTATTVTRLLRRGAWPGAPLEALPQCKAHSWPTVWLRYRLLALNSS